MDLASPRRRARWKRRRKSLKKLIPAMEMAQSEVGGHRRRDHGDRRDEGTVARKDGIRSAQTRHALVAYAAGGLDVIGHAVAEHLSFPQSKGART
jgi:hypothetical protein